MEGRGARRGDRGTEQREVRTAKLYIGGDPTSGRREGELSTGCGDSRGLLVAPHDQSDPVGRGRAHVV